MATVSSFPPRARDKAVLAISTNSRPNTGSHFWRTEALRCALRPTAIAICTTTLPKTFSSSKEPMGLDSDGAKFLFAARAAGVSFCNTATLGRQNFFPAPAHLQQLLDLQQ